MPDGDIIHPNINRRFQNVYVQLCEGHWEPAELGYEMLRPLKGQIKEYGNSPIKLGQRFISIILNFRHNLDLAGCFKQIEKLSINPEMNSSPRGRDLMKSAAKKLLIEIENGKSMDDIESNLYENYISMIFDKDFESRIPATPEHHANATYPEIKITMAEIRPHLENGIHIFTNQLIKHQDVSKLRRPIRKKMPPLKVEDSAW